MCSALAVREVMNQAPPRVTRIAHWIGLALSLPLIALGLFAFTEYLRGSFPPTVTGADAALVLGFILFSAAIMYLTPRIIVRLVSFIVARKIKG
jgi:hypothetical protein